ncbi:MAG: hypothetical protein OEZ36_14225 [Spirochaetota bacterium]|nr:hypothetical protein [Spirochaetota bacterium]
MTNSILFFLTIIIILFSFLVSVFLQAPVIEKFLFGPGAAFYISFAFKIIETLALVYFIILLGRSTTLWYKKVLAFMFFMFMFSANFVTIYMGQMLKWEQEQKVRVVKSHLDKLKFSLIDLKNINAKKNPVELLAQMKDMNSNLKNLYTVSHIQAVSSEVASLDKEISKPLSEKVITDKYLTGTIRLIDNTLKKTNQIINRVKDIKIEETIASRFRVKKVEFVVHLFNVLIILVMELFFIISIVYVIRLFFLITETQPKYKKNKLTEETSN